MTEAQEVRARAKALRERREELEKALAGAAGPGARPLRLELARVKEELVDCARRLKELMPSHKVRCRTTWAGVDGWRWDDLQYQTWAELESSEEPDGPTELDHMRLAVRLARERALTDKQGEYLAQVEGGKKAAQVAREDGGHGLQSQSHRTECWLEGWLAVPPELEQTAWDCAGYCDLDIQDGKLVGLTPREQPPKPEPEPDLTPQFRTAMLSYAATSTAIPDSYALDMSDLFPTWAAVLADGEELPEGRVLNDGGQLYRVVQAVTPQAHQAPHDEGMLAVYRPIDREHAGTADDPIPWVYGMDCHAGKCYRYNGKVYRVAEGGDMLPCTWPPDTPGMWQWEEVQA